MKTREELIDEMAKAIYATGVALDGTDYAFGIYDDDDHFHRMANALYAANIGDVTEWKERAEKHRVQVLPDGTIKQFYSDEEVEDIARQRDEYKHRAEVAERALVITAERVLEYAQKAKVTAMTSDGLFSCDKNAQLALLANDALIKAEQEMARKENNESDF